VRQQAEGWPKQTLNYRSPELNRILRQGGGEVLRSWGVLEQSLVDDYDTAVALLKK